VPDVKCLSTLMTVLTNLTPNNVNKPQPDGATLTLQDPWPGLAAYDESASEFFFGRAEEAAELLRMVRLTPLTVLYGKSGLGKTSLLQAGFFPLLRAEHYFPVYLRLDYSPAAALSPLDQAANKLKAALSDAAAEFPAWRDRESLWRYLHRRDLEIWSKDNYLLTPVLVFDQFEEIFSRGKENAEHVQSTFNTLADLIENRIPNDLADGNANRDVFSRLDLMRQHYRVVLSFREDFLPEIEGWKEQVPSLLRNRMRLLSMTRQRAIEAVTKAGASVLAPDVAQLLVDFVGNLDSSASGTTSVIEPVLLSLCCYQLNQRRSPGGKIDIDLLRHAGQDILQDFYDEALGGMPATASKFIETYLIQGNQYRSSYPVDQALQDGYLTREQLSILADKYRLLRIDQQLGVNRIELIHDRLVSVVSKARDERLQQEELLRLRAEEQERQRQLEFERAAADAVTLRRQARKLHAVLMLAVSLAGVAAYGWYTANVEKEKAQKMEQEARSLRLILESMDMAAGTRRGGDERAILQLLAMHRIAPSEAVDTTLPIMILNKNASKKIWSSDNQVLSVAFNHDGSRIISSSAENTLKLWDADSGNLITQRLNAHQCEPGAECAIMSVVFSPDGARVISGGHDSKLRVWNAQTLQPVGSPLQGHQDIVTSVAVSPDGAYFVSGSYDNNLFLWDAKTLVAVGKPMQGHEDIVTSVAFNADAVGIVSGSNDKTIRIWDAKTQTVVGEPLIGHTDNVTSVAFSHDGVFIVSGSHDKTLRLWDAQTRSPIGKPLRGHEDLVWSVDISHDGATIVSGSHDRTLRLWEAKTGQPIGVPIQGHEALVRSVAFSPDAKYIISGGRDTMLRLWDAKNSQPVTAQLKGGHKNYVASVAYSPNGNYIVSGSDDTTLQLWDAKNGKPIGKPMEGHTGSLNGVAFSFDSKLIVSGSSDGTLRLWDANNQQSIGKPMIKHRQGVESVAFSPDGKYIASGSKDNTVQLWEVKSRQPVGDTMTGHGEMVRGVAFNSDGRLIASASYDTTVRIWRTDTQKLIGELTGHEGAVTSVAFSPDDQVIVSASKDMTLRRWHVSNRQLVGEPMQGHEDRVNSVAFSPDGAHIVSGSSDKTLRLWNATTGQIVGGPMRGHEARVNSAIFSPDGKKIASGSDDMTLRIWPASNNWTAELCSKLTRNMNRKEWREWVSAEIEYQAQCPHLPVPSVD
jgi:WD40 repeat protein